MEPACAAPGYGGYRVKGDLAMVRRRPLLAAMVLASTCLVGKPLTAQEARACVNQVGQLAAAFAVEGDRGEVRAAIAQEPGSRKGTSLGEEQRRRIGALLKAARHAGERGDGQGCLQHLSEVRTALRKAGVGGGQPGTADSTAAVGARDSGGSGTTGGGSDPSTSLPSARGDVGASSVTRSSTSGGATEGATGTTTLPTGTAGDGSISGGATGGTTGSGSAGGSSGGGSGGGGS